MSVMCRCHAVLGKQQEGSKKIKRFEYASPCVEPMAPKMKRKILEVNSLFTAGYGGRIRGELGAVPVSSISIVDNVEQFFAQ